MTEESSVQGPRQAWFSASKRSTGTEDRQRVTPMEVLNLGMLRTGTMSMQRALDILGIPCYHGITIFSRISDCTLWNQALDAKYFNQGAPFTRQQWDQLLGEFGAASDAPVVAFAEDLIEAYPEAKVILVERDTEKWYKSFDEAVVKACFDPKFQFIKRFDPWFLGPLEGVNARWVRGWFKSHSADEMRSRARPMYHEHYELVRRLTPKERLLEYKLGSGWEPLCGFLGKPVPEEPFPRSNDLEAFREMVRLLMAKSLRNAARRLSFCMVPFVIVLTGFAILYARQG